MNTWIAFFRGINVVGKHKISMADLRQVLEQEACADVRTYIQSGNVVFQSRIADASRLATRLRRAVAEGRGFEPDVLVLGRAELEQAVSENPFPEADLDPKSLHLFFLSDRPRKPDLEAMDGIKANSESYVLEGRLLYLHTPAGFAGSKLAQRAERLLGVSATARNWRTVNAVLALASPDAGSLGPTCPGPARAPTPRAPRSGARSPRGPRRPGS